MNKPSPSFATLPPGLDLARLVARFKRHVDVGDGSGCWLWTGESKTNRYGLFAIETAGGRLIRFRAHRFAYELANGPIPGGLFVLHRCDVRKCCNPGHLFLGTHRDNALDMMKKGRGTGAKLTPDQVNAIRARLAAGAGPRTLSQEFSVRRELVRRIRKREAYAWVD